MAKVVFGQTLPVIPRSTYADEINACLKSSILWRSVHILRITENMRVGLQRDLAAELFAKQLLNIVNGNASLQENTHFIKLPENICKIVNSKEELIESVFPHIYQNYQNHQWLQSRAILAAKNLAMLPGNLISLKSIDTVVDKNEIVNYPTEFLNLCDLPGLPPHNLLLKVGSPIILLRNLNPPNYVMEQDHGKFKGENILLPRIPIIPTDVSIQFKRLQFPIRLAFAITINKSQGQTLKVCGLNLANPCFSHGQLYVACSRVGKPSDLCIHGQIGLTKNIVHNLALR
ncbi:uncharacterized protein LOC119662912 [Teleopsis dalmanni]|uniref:uncharacterized protein LOC119662912 n=1 Tax=Teleopsis dalmanni TaxID=139649 RepID=UPI0018CED06B|nr:uncharacterized protein LOC119662912 [Teleopsis dalmanni]